MYSKLLLVTLLSVALAAPQHQQAAQYPAGVNPQDCPGFPICDNARLHNPQSHWGAPAPSWQQPAHNNWQQSAHNNWQQPAHNNWQQPAPAWNAAPAGHWGAPANSWDHQPAAPSWNGAPAPGGDKFPAGVNPQSCPNYPFCDVNAGHHAAAAPPLPGYTERLYPAGVSPHECPNFPYCN